MDPDHTNWDVSPEANTYESATTHKDRTATKSGNTCRNGSARKNGTVRKNRTACKSKTVCKNMRSNGGGGGGGQGGGGIPVANWDPECRRGARFLNMDVRNPMVQTVDLGDDEFNAMFGKSNDNNNDLEEEDTSPIHERQILGTAARQLLLKIEASCKKVLLDSQCEAFELVKSLVHGPQLKNIDTAFCDDSLISLIHRCVEAEVKVSQVVFIQMLSFIHLRAKFERFVFHYYASVIAD